jgi:hypothetical protein
MAKRIAFLGVGLLVLAVSLSVPWFDPTGKFSRGNYLRIQAGMSLEEVESLLGGPGKEITEAEVTQVVDWDVPVDSPRRLKPVISGERLYKWREHPEIPFGGSYILISVVGGKVKEKFFWEPSL